MKSWNNKNAFIIIPLLNYNVYMLTIGVGCGVKGFRMCSESLNLCGGVSDVDWDR
jgi:hypothetical protein